MKTIHYFRAAALLLLISIVPTRANTLFFIASLDSLGNINYNWLSEANWYVPNPEYPGQYLPADQLPAPTDGAIVLTDSDAAGNNINLATLELGGPNPVTITGGNFTVGALQIASGCNFVGSSIEVDNSMSTGSPIACELTDSQVTIESGASWTVYGGVYLTDTVVYNIGQIIMTGGSALDGFDGGTGRSSIINKPDAVFSSFGGASVGSLGADLIFDQGGTVRCDAQTLSFNGGIMWTNSVTNFSKFRTTTTNATISINSLSTIPAGKTFIFSGPGTSLIFGDAATVEGTLQVGVVDSATQIIDVGTFDCQAGVTGTGLIHVVASNGFPSTFNWGNSAEGTVLSVPMVNIDSGGLVNVVATGGEAVTLSGCVMNNSGTFLWTGGGNIEFDADSTLNNLAGGLFNVASNGLFLSSSGAANIFNNAGTFRKTGGSGTTIFQSGGQPYFNNTGLVDVQTGILALGGGTNSGQVNVAAGAQFRFFWDNYALNPGSSFTGAGTIHLGGSTPTLFVNTGVTVGNFLMDGGTLDGGSDLAVSNSFPWSAGTTQGSGAVNIMPGAALNITGGTLNRTVNNSGMATLDTPLAGGNGAAFNNETGGVCDLTSNASFSFDGSGATAIFNNFGLVSNGVVGEPAISVPFTNAGMVQIQGRGITFGHGFDLGYTQISGSTTIAAGAALELAGATAVIRGGTLSGAGLVDGALTNMATVHPGFSPGVLTVNLLFGTGYTQGANGALAIDIAGLAAGTQFSQLAATGGVSLGGALNLSLINGFMPAAGDAFSIATFGSRNGAFTTVTGNHLSNGLVLVPRYSDTNVLLVAASDLNFTSIATHAGGLSFNFPTTAGFSYVVQFANEFNTPIPWQTLTNVTGNGLPALISDPDVTVPQRFYRVLFQ